MDKKIVFAIIAFIIMLTSSFAILDDFTYSSPNYTFSTPVVPVSSGMSTGYTNYIIDLYGVPAGSGTYTQLINITDPYAYGINSAGGNILFYTANNTELYAWTQSISSTSMSIWVKNYDGNSVIDMEVFPSSDNFYSKTGHLENLDMKFSGVSGLKANCFYANSLKGDYLNFTLHGNFTKITYEVNTTGLGDFAFFASQQGQGQLVRIDTRSAYNDSTIGSLSSWTSWPQPPEHLYLAQTDTWYFVSLTNVSGVWIYNITNEDNDTTTHIQNYPVSYDGSYFGFIGDALGASYITYWKNVTFYTSPYGTTGFFDTPSMPSYTIKQAYEVIFKESGLPAGSRWYVNITNGQSFSSTNSTISFEEPNGTYNYVVATLAPDYKPSTNSGSFRVSGNSVTVNITMISSLLPTAVDILSKYNIATSKVSPYVEYNNTYNNDFANTSTNKYNTTATSTITSVWVDAAYSDDNCTMVTNSYGCTILYSYATEEYHQIGSPYNTEKYYGPITGIAGTKSYDGSGDPLIILLTEDGYIFHYYKGVWSLFESSNGSIIKLPGSNWTSLTANTYASTTQVYLFSSLFLGTATYFYATNLNGTVWYCDSYSGDYGLFSSSKSPQGIISTAAYCDETATSDNHLYGLSYSGYIYYLTSTGWEIYNTTPTLSGSVSISISGLGNPYMYELNMHNKTSLYVSENTITSASTSGFTETGGMVDNRETNEALTVYHGDSTSYPIFWAFQTNGTVLYNQSSSNDPTSIGWKFHGDALPIYRYPKFLALNDLNSTFGFNITLLYNTSIGESNINNMSIYYNNTHLYKELSLVNGILTSYEVPVAINYSIPVAINITLKPNSAYNSYMEFYVEYYYKGVYIFYFFNINIVNHFSYWKIS